MVRIGESSGPEVGGGGEDVGAGDAAAGNKSGED